jgi:hypothetical protein
MDMVKGGHFMTPLLSTDCLFQPQGNCSIYRAGCRDESGKMMDRAIPADRQASRQIWTWHGCLFLKSTRQKEPSKAPLQKAFSALTAVSRSR